MIVLFTSIIFYMEGTMYIDTHCHIFNEYYDNIDNVILKCIENKVCRIIVSGFDINSNKEVLKLIDKYDIVYGTIGFHPTELDNFQDNYYSFLEEHINDKKIVGIGEIGLDYHYENTDKEKQQKAFIKQIEIANELKLPVVIHTRDSINDTYNILKDYNLNGSIHCFSGSLEMAKEFIKLGYKIGIGGVSTYKNAKNIKEVIKNIDLSYILLETDSPYLAPEPYRGKINGPENISELKNVTIQEVMRVSTSNAEAIFDFLDK